MAEQDWLTATRKSDAGIQFVKVLVENGLVEKVVITDEQEHVQMKKLEEEKNLFLMVCMLHMLIALEDTAE